MTELNWCRQHRDQGGGTKCNIVQSGQIFIFYINKTSDPLTCVVQPSSRCLPYLARWSMSGSPTRTSSLATSHTHVLVEDDVNDHSPQLAGSEDMSVIPDDKIVDTIQDKNDSWEHNPANPRNWSPAKKWTAAALVS